VTGVHPIEAESYRRLADRVDLSGLSEGCRAVVARAIHATADLDYAHTMVVTEEAVGTGVAALAGGAPVVVDVEMVRQGLSPGLRARARCGLAPAGSTGAPPPDGGPPTRSARGIRAAAAEHPDGAVVVVGCAPTALAEVVSLTRAGTLTPALVVGVPVGFVGAAEAKEALRATGCPAISNIGDKGGSALAAAIVNALARLVPDPDGGPGRSPGGGQGPR
jgi:precorrin-8X/cobalt-precorrin-8 methylmutase